MASIKSEKAVGSKPAGQAKKEPVKATVSKSVSSQVPKEAAVSIPISSTTLLQATGNAAPHALPSPPVPTAAPKALVSTGMARGPKKVEQKPQEPKKKVTGTKPAPAKKI